MPKDLGQLVGPVFVEEPLRDLPLDGHVVVALEELLVACDDLKGGVRSRHQQTAAGALGEAEEQVDVVRLGAFRVRGLDSDCRVSRDSSHLASALKTATVGIPMAPRALMTPIPAM